MLTYENDPWLLGKETANDLISERQSHLLFLDKEETILNLFSAFVKKSDFVKKDKIVQPLQKTIYVKVSLQLTKKLKKKFVTRKELKKSIEIYTKRRSSIYKGIDKWVKKQVFPFFVLRILSNNNEEFIKWQQDVKYFSDFLNKSRFYSPKTISELLALQLAYFVGCSMGDGHIDKDGRRWILVGGSSDKARLKESLSFVSSLSSLLDRYVNKSRITQIDNKYDLRVNNKPFCRFLHFFFALPYGKKKNVVLQVPAIFGYTSKDLQKYFWRGLFDTDGYAATSVSFCSSDSQLCIQLQKYLKKLHISPKLLKNSVSVPISDFRKFCYIGFAHQRKQVEFVERLKCGPIIKSVRLKGYSEVNPKFRKIYDVLRIDRNGFRIRIHSSTLNKKNIKLWQVNKIIKELFGYEFRKAANGMNYFKSKEVYEYLRSIFIYDNFWHPINEEGEDQLLHEWNNVWKQ